MASDILDVPLIKQRAVKITLEQYHALAAQGLIGHDMELLEGVIVEKMSKSPLHSSIVTRLSRILHAVLGEEWTIRSEQPITSKNSEPEPDFAVVATVGDDYQSGHPRSAELAIEVAVSSLEIDRRKTAIYAGAGVREYWIVHPETRQIEVHTALVHSRYSKQRIFSAGQTAFSDVLPALRVELNTLFR